MCQKSAYLCLCITWDYQMQWFPNCGTPNCGSLQPVKESSPVIGSPRHCRDCSTTESKGLLPLTGSLWPEGGFGRLMSPGAPYCFQVHHNHLFSFSESRVICKTARCWNSPLYIKKQLWPQNRKLYNSPFVIHHMLPLECKEATLMLSSHYLTYQLP